MNIIKYLNQFPSLEGKQILITGANSGIGFELCRHLLYKKANIVLLCRNLNKANQAREILLNEYPDASIEILEYDQSSFESIKKASEAIKERYQNFYGLVFNAGTLGPRKGNEFTKEGFPVTIGSNYLGLLYFYTLLVDFLNKSTITRKIVFQGSVVAGMKTPKGMDLLDDNYSQWAKYNLSKRCVECLYKYASSNNTNDNIHYLLSEPGVSKTPLFNSMNPVFRVAGGLFIKIMSHSPKKASLTMFRCLMEDTKNGDAYFPRLFNTVRGYPKKYKFNEKRYDIKYINRGFECIKK